MELFHALNRGVEKRAIVLDNQDRFRFVHDLYEFNDTHPALNSGRHAALIDVRRRSMREPLVDIHGWCLMNNHYHLLLSERKAGGMSKFLKKLNGGYAKYFNERYKRSGALFQGKTKRKMIEAEAYFLHILNYIHCNPLDYHQTAKSWRERRIQHSDAAITFLNEYRWSSFKDYNGIANFPSIIRMDLFDGVNDTGHAAHLQKYLRNLDETLLQAIAIE